MVNSIFIIIVLKWNFVVKVSNQSIIFKARGGFMEGRVNSKSLFGSNWMTNKIYFFKCLNV